MDRFVVISADCHAVGRPEDFRPFIEPQYLDVFDEENRKRVELAREARKASEEGGLLFSKEALEEYHSHDETEDNVMGGTSGQWDSDKRIKELEDDGVVAEVVFPNGGPFMTGRGGAPVPRELRTARRDAHDQRRADDRQPDSADHRHPVARHRAKSHAALERCRVEAGGFASESFAIELTDVIHIG
jgi:hypothetical protein